MSTAGKELIFRLYAVFLLVFIYAEASQIKWLLFEEGIKKAQQEKKLILLDIYAQWCHWCNVMENTTYRDRNVISLINRYFIPVRVDAEKRPDINKKYNQGGLPSTVILDYKGRTLWGAIYVPPDRMADILKKFSQMKDNELEKIAVLNEKKREKAYRRFARKVKEKEPEEEYIHKVYRYIKLKFDRKYGGFRGAPKFPEEELVHFLLIYSLIFSDEKAYKMMEKAALAYSRLIDPVEGGIYRYSTTENWKNPHYEKLLKDQADISVMFIDVFTATEKSHFKEFARQLINFSLEKLYSKKDKLFYNSQGADIVDEEGTILMDGEEYFILDRKEREKAVKRLGYSPKIEKEFYFSSNLLMARALLYSYPFFGKEDYLHAGLEVLDTVLNTALTEEGVYYSQAVKRYYLSTNVYALEAVLTAYQITGNKKYLNTGIKLAEILKDRYFSKVLGIFTDPDETGLSINRISFIDDVVLLNRRAVSSLYILSMFTAEEKYADTADSVVSRLPEKANINTGLAYTAYFFSPLVSHIVGTKQEEEFFIKKAFKVFPFWHCVQFVDKTDRQMISRLGYPYEKKTVIYLCNRQFCFEKLADINSLKDAVLKALKTYIH